jgi:hypothetical protein
MQLLLSSPRSSQAIIRATAEQFYASGQKGLPQLLESLYSTALRLLPQHQQALRGMSEVALWARAAESEKLSASHGGSGRLHQALLRSHSFDKSPKIPSAASSQDTVASTLVQLAAFCRQPVHVVEAGLSRGAPCDGPGLQAWLMSAGNAQVSKKLQYYGVWKSESLELDQLLVVLGSVLPANATPALNAALQVSTGRRCVVPHIPCIAQAFGMG